MRITFKNVSAPTRAAKRIKAQLNIKESTARNWTAQVFGYASWHELDHAVGQGSQFSRMDEDLNPEDLAARRAYQAAKLAACLAKEGLSLDAESVLATWRPSAARPQENPDEVLTPEEWKASGGDDKFMSLLETLGQYPDSYATEVEARLLRGVRNTSSNKLLDICKGSASVYANSADPAAKRVGRRLLEALAARGHYRSMFNLCASLLNDGNGESDLKRALGILQKLLETPDAPDDIKARATKAIAGAQAMYESRNIQGSRHAISVLTRGAELGEPDAALRLATYFDPTIEITFTKQLETEGLPAKDKEQAAKYYRIAAHKGSVEAATRIGLMLTSPQVLADSSADWTKDFNEGVRWLKYAYLRGDRDSMEQLRSLSNRFADAVKLHGVKAGVTDLAAAMVFILDNAEPMEVAPEIYVPEKLSEGVYDHEHEYSMETGLAYQRLLERYRTTKMVIVGRDKKDTTGRPFVCRLANYEGDRDERTEHFATEPELTAYLNQLLEAK